MTHTSTDQRMVVGTLVTGFYAIDAGSPERLSPVFSTRGAALAWLELARDPWANDPDRTTRKEAPQS